MTNTSEQLGGRERVRVEITAYLVETFEDGGAKVDADGVEFYVEPQEWSYR